MKTVAIVIEDECQDQEVWGPIYVAKAFGWDVTVFGPPTKVALKHGTKIESELSWDALANWTKGHVEQHDAVIIPGGWGAERLRQNQYVLRFVREMHAAGKVVAAICHGPWVLASAGLWGKYKNWPHKKKATCYPGCKDDLINAGAKWVDQPVVTDGNVVTAQHYRDVPQFMQAIAELLKQ